MIFVFNFNFKGFSMYLFKDFILSINYGPTNERAGERANGCGLPVAGTGTGTPLGFPSASGFHLLSSRARKVATPHTHTQALQDSPLDPWPNSVWLCSDCRSACVCQTVASRLSVSLLRILGSLHSLRSLCSSVVVDVVVLVVVCIWFSFTYEAP